MKTNDFKIGDEVRLKLGKSPKPGPRQTTKISIFYGDIPGGVRLDAKLGDFFSWNVEDLEHA